MYAAVAQHSCAVDADNAISLHDTFAENECNIRIALQGVIRLEKYTEDGVQLAGSADLATIAVIQPYITEFTPRERVFEWRQEQALATEE